MWNLRSRLSPRPPGPDANDPVPPEVERLVAGAFPRPQPSDALRERVAAACREGTAAPQPLRAPLFRRYGLALAATLLLLALLPFLTARRGGDVAYADDAPLAGRLAILDDQGRPAGLCPLKHTDVRADVSGYVARVTVKQEFVNPSREPAEAIYTFPLPEDAAVDSMTMTIGDRVVKGEIKKREEAREIYDDAQREGKTTALLDQERPNIFTQSVANMMPGQAVTITISYVNLLKYDDGQYEFVFPMVVGPRHISGSGGYMAPGLRGEPSPARQVDPNPGTTPVVTDAEKITPPIAPKGTRAGHDISVTVNVDAGVPIQDLKSELHQVDLQREGDRRATVRLRDQRSIPNKDFILRYGVAGDEVRTAVLAHGTGGGSGYFTLIAQPPKTPRAAEITPKEIVFVIDQTGSQSGWPIKKAKETMRYLIRNMNPDDTFQLLGFNTEVFPCFEQPVPNSPENVARALRFLDPIEGEGGTDILRAVDYALQIPLDAKRRRIICYLTDGYVGDDMQIIDYVRRHRERANMFPFGIGDAPNRFLLEGMAREGNGTAEFVTLQSSAEEAAARFYRRVTQPLLVDVAVDWGGLGVEDVYPTRIPDMFVAGRPIVLKGRYTRPGAGHVTLRGTMDGRPWSQTVHVELPAQPQGGESIPTLWAREKIEDLIGQDYLGAQTGNPNPRIKEQIVNLALDFRLMSQYTSFVAVEQRVVNLGGRQRTLDVPVEMPSGVSHEGIFGGEGEPVEQWSTVVDGSPGPAGYAPAPGGMAGGMMGGMGAPSPVAVAPSLSLNKTEAESNSTGAPAAGAAAARPPGANPFRPNRERRRVLPVGPAAGSASAPQWRGKRVQIGGTYLPRRQPDTGALYHAQRSEPGRRNGDAFGPMGGETDAAGSRLKPSKLSGALQAVVQSRAAGKRSDAVTAGRVEVQVWLNQLPPDGLKQLKALGFELAAELRPGKLVLGTVPVERLEALAKLAFVRRVEQPSFR